MDPNSYKEDSESFVVALEASRKILSKTLRTLYNQQVLKKVPLYSSVKVCIVLDHILRNSVRIPDTEYITESDLDIEEPLAPPMDSCMQDKRLIKPFPGGRRTDKHSDNKKSAYHRSRTYHRSFYKSRSSIGGSFSEINSDSSNISLRKRKASIRISNKFIFLGLTPKEPIEIRIDDEQTEIIHEDSLDSVYINNLRKKIIQSNKTENKGKQEKKRMGWSKINLDNGSVIYRPKKKINCNTEYSFNHKGELMLSKRVNMDKILSGANKTDLTDNVMSCINPEIKIREAKTKPSTDVLENFNRIAFKYGKAKRRSSKSFLSRAKMGRKSSHSLYRLNSAFDSNTSHIGDKTGYRYKNMEVYRQGRILENQFGATDEINLEKGVFFKKTIVDKSENDFSREDASDAKLSPTFGPNINNNNKRSSSKVFIQGEAYMPDTINKMSLKEYKEKSKTGLINSLMTKDQYLTEEEIRELKNLQSKKYKSSVLKLNKDKLVRQRDGVVIRLSELSTPITDAGNDTFFTQKILSNPAGLNQITKSKKIMKKNQRLNASRKQILDMLTNVNNNRNSEMSRSNVFRFEKSDFAAIKKSSATPFKKIPVKLHNRNRFPKIHRDIKCFSPCPTTSENIIKCNVAKSRSHSSFTRNKNFEIHKTALMKKSNSRKGNIKNNPDIIKNEEAKLAIIRDEVLNKFLTDSQRKNLHSRPKMPTSPKLPPKLLNPQAIAFKASTRNRFHRRLFSG
ncbi:unnamed protein product [Moneuplotes crassus]|uniref:Uncharacterized protein n=1 Tax=Euplotes crassus TaxID=5936 RepID=A0AAD1XYP2_EUPCR|nr:unnamed protein product [Moneuplotes crassus]